MICYSIYTNRTCSECRGKRESSPRHLLTRTVDGAAHCVRSARVCSDPLLVLCNCMQTASGLYTKYLISSESETDTFLKLFSSHVTKRASFCASVESVRYGGVIFFFFRDFSFSRSITNNAIVTRSLQFFCAVK